MFRAPGGDKAAGAAYILGMRDEASMIDPFGRGISYLRVSVTDRCDFRCVYCMAEDMTFLPKADILSLEDLDYRTGGPARYVRVAETGGRLGFITPLTHNFCESCNRVRVTCTGTLYMCLGQEDAADLRKPLRASEANDLLHAAIEEAISRKPKGHDFIIDRRHKRPALARHMSVTGG